MSPVVTRGEDRPVQTPIRSVQTDQQSSGPAEVQALQTSSAGSALVNGTIAEDPPTTTTNNDLVDQSSPVNNVLTSPSQVRFIFLLPNTVSYAL
jgi:hypothetical protein